MDELLSKLTQGVDLQSPDAFWVIFGRLMAAVPWLQLTLWSVLFVVVGAGLGWWRGRLREGIVWALLLGPIGWIIVLRPPRHDAPPPLPPRPPPLPPRQR